MDYLAAHHYNPISINELGAALFNEATLPPKPIVITFDDGYRDSYTDAFPILLKHKFKATNFVITGVVDGSMLYLTWEQIKEMNNSGIFTFGAHTMTHRALTELPLHEVRWEMRESRKALEYHLGYRINWLAYPYGNVNEAVAKEAELVGFVGAFGTNSGTYQSTNALFTLPRIRIGGGDSIESFAAKLPWK
jgi:peptidoglycan/xylan/chitin deacetylase (PgdA/CDA1 family)